MYTDADLMLANRQKNRRLSIAGIALVLAIAALVIGCTLRIQPIATFGTAFFACLFYAILELYAMPCVRYAQFLGDMHNGMRRQTTGEFIRMDDQPRMNAGIACYDLYVREPNDDTEILFYLDAEKPRPHLESGQQIKLTSFGNYVTNFE